MKYSLLLLFLFCLESAAMQWHELQSLLPKGTQVSYFVVDAKSAKSINSYQKEILRTPASIQKLLTATAAKLYLGKEFHYSTTIQGNKSFIRNGRYHGDLRFSFSGDPTLSRDDIRQMLRKLKRVGINKIEGDLLLDNSQFNGYQWSDGQAWNDLGVCYTAPSNAIIINKNCVLGNLSSPSDHSNKARLYIPSYEPVSITSNVSVVSKAQQDANFCELEVTRNSQNHYHLWGCMVSRKRPMAMAFSVNDPVSYAKHIIASELRELGIELAGRVTLATKNELKKPVNSVLAFYSSPSLDDLVIEMMKDSDNLIADSLFKTIGGQYFNQPGNYRNGAEAVKVILQKHGINLENAYIADGSGLSRHNLMSSELFMSVMRYVYQHDNELGLLSSFSIAGVDGTLQYRAGLRKSPFKGKIIAKSGSLKGVANLIGLVKSKHGDKLFVLMINGYNNEVNEEQSASNTPPKISVTSFEKAFFEKILD